MMGDLAERNIDERIFESLVNYINESIELSLDKYNVVRVV
jgi:hypothetical protein